MRAERVAKSVQSMRTERGQQEGAQSQELVLRQQQQQVGGWVGAPGGWVGGHAKPYALPSLPYTLNPMPFPHSPKPYARALP